MQSKSILAQEGGEGDGHVECEADEAGQLDAKVHCLLFQTTVPLRTSFLGVLDCALCGVS